MQTHAHADNRLTAIHGPSDRWNVAEFGAFNAVRYLSELQASGYVAYAVEDAKARSGYLIATMFPTRSQSESSQHRYLRNENTLERRSPSKCKKTMSGAGSMRKA